MASRADEMTINLKQKPLRLINYVNVSEGVIGLIRMLMASKWSAFGIK
jgi:hypothetical protein